QSADLAQYRERRETAIRPFILLRASSSDGVAKRRNRVWHARVPSSGEVLPRPLPTLSRLCYWRMRGGRPRNDANLRLRGLRRRMRRIHTRPSPYTESEVTSEFLGADLW